MNLHPSLAIKGQIESVEVALTKKIDEERRIQRRGIERGEEMKSSARMAAYREAYALVAGAGATIDKILDEMEGKHENV